MIQQLLKEFCDETEYSLDNGLIQNENHIPFQLAKELEPALVLRWRYRICRLTGRKFDITKDGFYYVCLEDNEDDL